MKQGFLRDERVMCVALAIVAMCIVGALVAGALFSGTQEQRMAKARAFSSSRSGRRSRRLGLIVPGIQRRQWPAGVPAGFGGHDPVERRRPQHRLLQRPCTSRWPTT